MATVNAIRSVSFEPAAESAGKAVSLQENTVTESKQQTITATVQEDTFIKSAEPQDTNPYDNIGKNSLNGKTPENKEIESKDADKSMDKNKLSNPFDKKVTDEEKKTIEELKKRNSEVQAHEQAHIAAGGGLVRGGAKFEYTVGPDGKRYAIGGEVSIDISPASDPRATIQKMGQVRRAALAPADPSSQDMAVASKASQIEAEAARELQNQAVENQIKANKKNGSSNAVSQKTPVKENQYIQKVLDQYKKSDEIKKEDYQNLTLNQVL
ncbi:MAG: hypothetical protein QG635_1280 [Bacteroidota bacterium]|nr:hypothetical protein [Bacteroidota bacterium]